MEYTRVLKRTINEVMERPMDRRQFLAHTGAAVLAVVGVTSVLKAFKSSGGETKRSGGYGGRPYGH